MIDLEIRKFHGFMIEGFGESIDFVNTKEGHERHTVLGKPLFARYQITIIRGISVLLFWFCK